MKDLLVAGDTLDFVTAVPDFPANSGWTLKYQLVPQFATPTMSVQTLTATTYETTDYRVQVGITTTATWVAGEYAWFSWVEKSGQRETVDSGFLTIQADPASVAQGYDGRSLAVTAYEAAKVALANFQATSGRVKRYVISGREMEFDSAEELVKLVKFWENEVSKEEARNAKRAGRPDPRRFYVGYTRG